MRPWLLLGISLFGWVQKFGGPGLILLGIADSSLVPLPGSMDVAVVLLSSSQPGWWPFYAAMATVGGLLGGFFTYRLAKKGGKETLTKKVGEERANKVYRRFEKKGFATVFVGAVLPPPFPIVPFLMAAGVLQYPRKKFLCALGLGRGARYFALAYVGHNYGSAILRFFGRYRTPILYALIALAVMGGVAALLYFKYYRPRRRAEQRAAGEPVEELPIPGKGNQKLRETPGQEPDDDQQDHAETHPERRTA